MAVVDAHICPARETVSYVKTQSLTTDDSGERVYIQFGKDFRAMSKLKGLLTAMTVMDVHLSSTGN